MLDGNVASAEVTAQPIPAGNVQITGGGTTGFTQAQATDLANVLKYGSLPLDFQLQTVEGISDTVSFLAAVLLYHFAVSDVQGFATRSA